jgi:hypothetical protein
MGYLVFTVAAIALFAGFLLLTRYEERRGVRTLALTRTDIDARVERLTFILTHVDFESFTREQLRVLAVHVAHDIAHLSLLSVRAVERLLSRLVKHLRTRHGIETASSAAPRAFVKTMSEFKQTLASTRPPIPEI